MVKMKQINIPPAKRPINCNAVNLVRKVTAKVINANNAMKTINLKLVVMSSMMYLLFSDLIIAEHLSKVKLYICNHTNFIALQYATPNFNLSN